MLYLIFLSPLFPGGISRGGKYFAGEGPPKKFFASEESALSKKPPFFVEKPAQLRPRQSSPGKKYSG